MKLPLPVVVVFIGLVVVLALIAFRPKASTSVVASNGYSSGYNYEARVTINDQAINSFSEVQKPPLSWLPAADISPNHVYTISHKNKQVSLILIDGSIKKLTAIDIENLSEQLKLQVTYEASK